MTGPVLYKEWGPASTAAVNMVLEVFVIVSKMETSGSGGDAEGGVLGMMLE